VARAGGEHIAMPGRLAALPGYAVGGLVGVMALDQLPRAEREQTLELAGTRNSRSERSITINMPITFQGGTSADRRTQEQQAAALGRAVQRAFARGTA
jgi:hypothetical protein